MRALTEAKELGIKIAEAHRELSDLNAIARVPGESLDLGTVLGFYLDNTLEVMKGNIVDILQMDKERQVLCDRVHHIIILSSCHGYSVVTACIRVSFPFLVLTLPSAGAKIKFHNYELPLYPVYPASVLTVLKNVLMPLSKSVS